jgi:hypothetical protein
MFVAAARMIHRVLAVGALMCAVTSSPTSAEEVPDEAAKMLDDFRQRASIGQINVFLPDQSIEDLRKKKLLTAKNWIDLLQDPSPHVVKEAARVLSDTELFHKEVAVQRATVSSRGRMSAIETAMARFSGNAITEMPSGALVAQRELVRCRQFIDPKRKRASELSVKWQRLAWSNAETIRYEHVVPSLTGSVTGPVRADRLILDVNELASSLSELRGRILSLRPKRKYVDPELGLKVQVVSDVEKQLEAERLGEYERLVLQEIDVKLLVGRLASVEDPRLQVMVGYLTKSFGAQHDRFIQLGISELVGDPRLELLKGPAEVPERRSRLRFEDQGKPVVWLKYFVRLLDGKWNDLPAEKRESLRRALKSQWKALEADNDTYVEVTEFLRSRKD